MSQWCSFVYRGFWDQPRILYTSNGEQFFLFNCLFDDDKDDYPESYSVYLMPSLSPTDLSESWEGIERKALLFLGKVGIPLSALDPTRRQQIDLDILNQVVPS